MPLYDYRCSECDHEFEVLQGISDEPLTDCPECKQSTLGKLVSAPAFTFKGGGWYKDLYSSAGANKEKSSAPAGDKAESSAKPTDKGSSAKPAKSD